jgi:hypothetical protein
MHPCETNRHVSCAVCIPHNLYFLMNRRDTQQVKFLWLLNQADLVAQGCAHSVRVDCFTFVWITSEFLSAVPAAVSCVSLSSHLSFTNLRLIFPYLRTLQQEAVRNTSLYDDGTSGVIRTTDMSYKISFTSFSLRTQLVVVWPFNRVCSCKLYYPSEFSPSVLFEVPA